MLALHLLIRLLGQLSFEAEDQLCHPGDNITNSKLFSLKSKNIGKPTLNFKANFWPNVTTPISEMLFGLPKMPELGTTHCHPFTEDLTNLLMDEYNFSLNRIVSDVQTIGRNPWWCTGKYLSEALLFAEHGREHVVYKNCSECQKQFLYITCCP